MKSKGSNMRKIKMSLNSMYSNNEFNQKCDLNITKYEFFFVIQRWYKWIKGEKEKRKIERVRGKEKERKEKKLRNCKRAKLCVRHMRRVRERNRKRDRERERKI